MKGVVVVVGLVMILLGIPLGWVGVTVVVEPVVLALLLWCLSG